MCPLAASPACIFHSISPPSWSFRCWGRRICLRVPAGPCCCSPYRRAFFIPFPRRSWSFRRLRRRICHRVPAGPCCSSPHRRAFLIANSRRRARLAAWGVEYVSVCPLVAAVLRLAGVHFLSRIPAGVIVSPLETENMSPCARWSLPFFILPACIFHSISPRSWSFRLCRRRICLRVPAGRCRCSPHRRAKNEAVGKSIALHRGRCDSF